MSIDVYMPLFILGRARHDFRRFGRDSASSNGLNDFGGGHFGPRPVVLSDCRQAGARRHGGVFVHRQQHFRRGLWLAGALAPLCHRHRRERVSLRANEAREECKPIWIYVHTQKSQLRRSTALILI